MTHRTASTTVLLATLLAAAAACDDREQRPVPGRALPETRPTPTAGVTPARYVTDLGYVATDTPAFALYFRFHNRVTPGHLERRYGAWSSDGRSWRPLLDLSDTLPTPRAGWRLLPSDSLRIRVGEGGELRSLRLLSGPGGPLRLSPDTTLSDWTGPTGQRERFRLARLEGPHGTSSGLLVERRKALPAEAGDPGELDRIFLLSDGAGDGLLLLLYGEEAFVREAAGDSAAAAYSWIGGEEARWQAATLRRADGGAGEAEGADDGPAWRLRLPEAGISGVLRTGEVVRSPGPAAGGSSVGAVADTSFRLLAVSGQLSRRGSPWPVTGLVVAARGP